MTEKEALKAWTKARPLLLNNTGVSEILRKLPADNAAFVDLAELQKVVDELDGKISEKKIAAEKKAVAGLKAIQEAIKKDMTHVTADRKSVIALLKEIHTAAKTYRTDIKYVKGGQLSLKQVSAFDCSAQTKKVDAIVVRGQDQSAVKKKHLDTARASIDAMNGKCTAMSNLMKLVLQKPPKLTPEEFKRDYEEDWKAFGDEMDKLEPIWKKIEAY